MSIVRAVYILIWGISSTVFSSAVSDDSVDLKTMEQVAQSPYWIRLLHYDKAFLGGYRSRVDGQSFFFAEDGKRNPFSELQATVAAFSKNIEVGRYKQHPQCAFPERYRFLKEELHLKTQDVECPKLNEYLAKFNPESVTLVFSSAYPHNPGSMFGHTFLRINSKSRDQKKQDLLDWGISYAARVGEDENPFAFVYLGLTGGYEGQFSLLPYYAKVNEYINNESRDLWEYELTLNREETYRLLRNVWEVETNSFFDYYFLDENCAYELLAFLEVAKPDWKLLDFPIYVIPGETVKKVAQTPGTIKNIKYRPSLQKKVMRSYEKLTAPQKEIFEKVMNFQEQPETVNEAAVLEEVSDYLLFVKKKNDNELNADQQKLLRTALVKRSSLGKVTVEQEKSDEVVGDSRPDLAHNTYKMGFALGREFRDWIEPKGQYFQELQFKFAFHDLLNSDVGYIPFSQLDFPALTVRYYDQDHQFKIENIHVLSVTSLSPLTSLDKHPSWAFHIEVLSPKDLQCDHCQVFHFDLGAGLTLGLRQERAVLYSLGLVALETGSSFQHGYRILPEWQWGAMARLGDKYKIQGVVSYLWDLFPNHGKSSFVKVQLNQSLAFSQSWEIRWLNQAILSNEPNSRFYESRLALNFYF